MVSAAIITALIAAIALCLRKILFAIGKLLCWIVGFLTDVFEVVAGLKNVSIVEDSVVIKETKFINVFFGDSTINTIYWGMALIGIVMCFAFAIFAVIKKSADAGEKMKQSYGDIIRNGFKGIVLILLMNFIMSGTLYISSTLLDRINYLMLNANNFDFSYNITFSPEQYGAMARCLNTIGNYSLNSSYNNRYNLNTCYNNIRKDLKELADEGVFDVTYITTEYDEDGNAVTVNTWQSVLENIYRSVDDINAEQPVDEYNTKLANALLEAMDIINNDATFEALEVYHVKKTSQEVGEMVSLDRMIMLIGSMYGDGGSMTDYLRGPYYYGQKDIFDYDEVSDDFDMSIGTWLYLTVIVVAFLFIKEMLVMVFNATARVFNMLLLYVSAPPFIAVTPLDDGAKLKQWTTSFIIQSFGLFGSVISLRLVMLFIPMLFNGNIQIFESVKADTFARIIIMYGAIFTARKASGMIVGILADNAGMQAVAAGDVGSDAKGAVERGVGYGKALGGMAIGAFRTGLGKADAAVDKARSLQGGGSNAVGGNSTSGAVNTLGNVGNRAHQNMLEMGSRTSTGSQVAPRPIAQTDVNRGPNVSQNQASESSVNSSNNSIPPAPVLPNGAYVTAPQAPELPSGAYSTVPQAPELPSGSYSTVPQAPVLPSGAYSTVPQAPELPSGAYSAVPRAPELPNGAVVSEQSAPSQNNAVAGSASPSAVQTANNMQNVTSKTLEDYDVSERRNRAVPQSLTDAFK